VKWHSATDRGLCEL